MRLFSSVICKFPVGVLVILVCSIIFLDAQPPGGYSRKSISRTTTLLTIGGVSLSAGEESRFIDVINTAVQIPRFDYNPLPDKIQASFKQRLSQHKNINESDLVSVINETLVPEIINVLNIQKEIRAQNLVSETQRNSFIVLKAKESGVTAEQLEQIMNSSFIYVPFISSYKAENNKEKKEVSVSLSGGLLWFHVIAGDEPRVDKIATLTSEGQFSAKTDEMQKINGKRVEPQSYAFWGAANTLAMNLEIKTRELDMFKLTAPIVEIERRKISFPLG